MQNLTEEDRFIEKAGVFLENLGISQMSGRVLGYLMISENPTQSLTEITERLGVAKSSISNAVKTLLTITMVVKKGKPGSRMDYYELNPDLFRTAISSKTVAITDYKNLVAEAYKLNKEDNDRKKILNEMIYFYDFFIDEYPKLFERWDTHRLKLVKEGKLSD